MIDTSLSEPDDNLPDLDNDAALVTGLIRAFLGDNDD